jgi:hypothetical protein
VLRSLTGNWSRGQVGSRWVFEAQQLPSGLYSVAVASNDASQGVASVGAFKTKHLDGAAPL